MKELKNCPFCNGEVNRHYNLDYEIMLYLCDDCGACVSFRRDEDTDKAWNRRTKK